MAKTLKELEREQAIKKTAEKAKQNNSTSTTSKNYDSGTDYQAKINDAVSKGDYTSAAKYEQQRNEKINDLNASGTNIYNATTTNNYSQYLGTTPSGGTSSGGGNSPTTKVQYTPLGTFNDVILPTSSKNVISYHQQGYTDAMAAGNIELANWHHSEAEKERAKYGYSGGEDGSDYIKLEQEIIGGVTPSFNYSSAQPTYSGSKYDPQIDELLNQILNRDDFSYDVTKDPLYQQYAQSYQRESDRAIEETLAEAAAGAGGMNSYAITAAQQAGNYYGSQLNDKIPELYQLAYDMYLNDKESKVQDLGILQNMDATQYNRYRDTMADWKDDRNFAYGVYRDNVADSQWQQSFDYNSFINDRDFAYNSDWDNKKWDYNVEQDAIVNNRNEQETAKEEVWKLIELGVPVSDELLKQAGYEDSDIKYNGGDNGNYATASNMVATMVQNNDKGGAKTYLQEVLNAGYITWSECAGLISKYGL